MEAPPCHSLLFLVNHPTRELDLPDCGALVVGGGALVGSVVPLVDAADLEDGAGGPAAVGESGRVEARLRIGRRTLPVRLVFPVHLLTGGISTSNLTTVQKSNSLRFFFIPD